MVSQTREESVEKLSFLLYRDPREIMSILGHGPISVTAISNISGIKRDVVVYYLNRLQELGIIGDEYEIIREPTDQTRGKAGMVYHINKPVLGEHLKTLEKFADSYREMLQTVI